MAGVTIAFHFTDTDAEKRFVESYLVDAWSRFEESDYWNHGWFWPYGQIAEYDAGPNGGLVRVVFDGNLDGLRRAEKDRWLVSYHLLVALLGVFIVFGNPQLLATVRCLISYVGF